MYHIGEQITTYHQGALRVPLVGNVPRLENICCNVDVQRDPEPRATLLTARSPPLHRRNMAVTLHNLYVSPVLPLITCQRGGGRVRRRGSCRAPRVSAAAVQVPSRAGVAGGRGGNPSCFQWQHPVPHSCRFIRGLNISPPHRAPG